MVPRKTEEKWEPIDSLGTTGATVAKNIRRIRLARGFAYTELSERLALLEREIPTWGLRKIESGGRRVDVDDLMAMASALGVSPITFLMADRNEDDQPLEPDDVVPITGWLKPIPARWLWGWLTARHPLVTGTQSTFIAQAWPGWLQRQFYDGVREMQRKQREAGGWRQARASVEGDAAEEIPTMLDGPDGDD